jgi:hypothetical protein
MIVAAELGAEIPLGPPFAKGSYPLLEKRGKGRFVVEWAGEFLQRTSETRHLSVMPKLANCRWAETFAAQFHVSNLIR